MKFFALIVLFLLISASAFASAAVKPSWLLIENEGDIFSVEVNSGTVVNVTADLDEYATYPYWSTNGEFISFIITDELSENTYEVPYGVAAWVSFIDGDFEINTVAQCELRGITCTDASIHGEWMVFTAIRSSDEQATLYAFNITDEELKTLQTGGFEIANSSNRWEDGKYIVIGLFGTYQWEARIFNVSTPGFETSDRTGTPAVGYLGCNITEVASELGRGIVQVNLDQNARVLDFIEYDGRLGQGRAWRNCNATQPEL